MLPGDIASPRPAKRCTVKLQHSRVAPLSPPLVRRASGRNSGKRQAREVQQQKIISPPKSPEKTCAEDMEEINFIPPTPEEAARIIEQVEFYFSDVNIMKDTFLLQHIKHNKDGYISLKLLSGFKRIKHLVKNWRELAYALGNGTQLLQLNEERTKIRRVTPLPSYDATAILRTVVAFDLPLDKPVTIKSVAGLFAPCGKLVLVRILLPKNPIPADVRSYLAGSPALCDVCALVEFSDMEGAQCALNRRPACVQAAALRWNGMKVVPLSPQERGYEQPLPKIVCFNLPADRRPSGMAHTNRCPSPMILEQSSPSRSPRPTRRCAREAVEQRRNSCPTIEFYRPRHLNVPENVLRMPRGPDGTRGFRPRPNSPVTTE